MKKILLALLFGLLALLVVGGLAWWSLPAETAWARVAKQVPALRLQGLTGRVWEGQAQGVSVKALPMGSATWRFSPWQALSGVGSGELSLRGGPIELNTNVRAEGHNVTLRALKATVPGTMLEPALDIPSLKLQGRIDIVGDEIQIVDGILKSATGVLTWNDLGVSGLAEARIGNVRVDFAPEGNDIVGTIRDTGGPLAIAGTVRVQGQTFHAEVNLDAREDSVREALLYVGERKPNGGSLLRVDGVIEKLY
ncbi:hypothetical protein C7S18_05305 [Ahniella affigens]|uniref:Type II secretion system protein N n=1 Tax=Ahniella affigens TaxID=2021234 RepID=A0A2P1PPA1_9GAMM|nr:type II secretion system protein N [Ahniella affigens]AVP96656.1 hypothetical protein C7S18_05305 [Ahniella affigens]